MTKTPDTKNMLSSLLLSIIFSPILLAQKPPDYSGDWALKLGGRVFIVVTLAPIPGGGTPHYNGSLARPQHFSTSGGASFSGIGGPVVHFPIVESTAKENCLFFTTQNPADANDRDDFQLCVADEGQATLKIDLPGFDAWPVSKETAPVVVASDWDSARSYLLVSSDVSSPEMKKVFDEDHVIDHLNTSFFELPSEK